jgi:PAS domain S-box-containing protein
MKKASILIVEDESIVALDIQGRLQGLGYTVVGLAASGQEALNAVDSLHPDLVLMDIQLKGPLDGIETVLHLKNKADVPVIYLTAFADETTLQRAKVTESFGYLIKPFEQRELVATIETALYKHRTEQRIKANEQWLSTTLKSIGDAVITTDMTGQINFMNPVAETLTGWPLTEARHQPITRIAQILTKNIEIQAEHPVTQVLHTNQKFQMENYACLIDRSGGDRPVSINVAPIQNDKNQIQGVVLVFRDVSREHQAEAKLRQSALQLQADNEELDAFAHTVAHDLQTPLAHIVSLSDALRTYHDTLSSAELQDFLDKLVNNGLKMSRIIDSLLLLAGVRRKEIVKTSLLDMDKIIVEAQQRLTTMIEASRPEIILPPSWPAAMGYAPWVEEIWVNYLSNALKYGGHPPIIRLGAEAIDQGMVRHWIKDNGPGISPQAQKLLFTPFTQLTQVHLQGQGLGLSIVRRIVEKLGGNVGVESQGIAGEGSTFYFTLPAPPPK